MPLDGFSPLLVGFVDALALALILDAARRADWQASVAEHALWALATAGILLARQMSITLPGGFTVHYIGAAWLALLLGYPRAVLSMSLIAIAHALRFGVPLSSQGLPLLLLGIAPAWLIWLITRACRRWLPPNPFVFLLGVGLIGLFLAYALPLLASAALVAMAIAGDAAQPAGAHALAVYRELLLPYALLLASGEAWLEGMLTTLLVVFAPRSVRLFDESYYLRRR